MRGIVSNGMLVSERELELSEAHEGIIELPADMAKHVGARYVDVMGLADPVIEVKLTPNRPDCTGVRGIARDLAAAGLGKLKPEPKIGKVEGELACPIAIKLEFSKETADACPVFAGRFIKGVTNGPSPAWLQNRLKAVGLRPINALVDVTNYISQDRGRPLHVYDADKLWGPVRARLGQNGETLLGLDGKEHAIDEEMCVIADDNGPLGLGGVMGGEASGSTEATKNVLIESAYFDPRRTAATGRRSGLMTDARYRFERGVDPAFVLPGLDLATDMILKLCGGEPSKAKIAGKAPAAKRVIPFDFARVAKLTGLKLKDSEIKTILEKLGCTLDAKTKTVKVTVPTWRPDIHGPADLVEEVVRIAGLDRVPATPLPRAAGIAKPVLTERQRRARRARRLLAGRGLIEAVTWSFIPRAEAQAFGGGARRARARQPDLDRDVVDAPEPASGSSRRGQAQPQPRLRRRGPVRAGPGLSRRRTRGSDSRPLRACAPAPPSSAAAGVTGTVQRATSTCSTPRPTCSPSSPRSASIRARRRSPAMRPLGITRAAPARCGSDPSSCSRTSAKCIRRRSRRSTSMRRPSASRSSSTRCRRRRRRAAPRPPFAAVRPACPSSATSPSCSILPLRPATWCAPRSPPTRRSSKPCPVFDVFEGGSLAERRQEVARHRGDPATDGRDHDG